VPEFVGRIGTVAVRSVGTIEALRVESDGLSRGRADRPDLAALLEERERR